MPDQDHEVIQEIVPTFWHKLSELVEGYQPWVGFIRTRYIYIIYIYFEVYIIGLSAFWAFFEGSFVNAESSAREIKVPPTVSASDRDPFASDLGPSTFVSCALSPRASSPSLRRAYPRAHALGVARRRRA